MRHFASWCLIIVKYEDVLLMTVIIIVLFVGFWASKRPLSKGVRKIVTFLTKNVTIRNPFDFQWFTNVKS